MFRFTSFSNTILFLLQYLIQLTVLFNHPIFLISVCNHFLVSFFKTLIHLKNALHLAFDLFLMVSLGCGCWGRKPPRESDLLVTSYEGVQSMSHTDEVNCHHWLRWGLPHLFTIELPFSPFCSLSVGSKSLNPAPTQKENN